MHKTIHSILGLTLSLAIGSAFSQPEQVKETPPAGGAPKDFELPVRETFKLDNGLQVTMVPYGSLPKVTVRAIIQAGNLNEGTDTWLADLTGDMLQEGTSSRSAEQVAQEAAAMGGSVSINIGLDQTLFTGDVLSEFGPDIVTLLADVVRNPALPESELERLRRDRLRNLSVALSQPQTKATIAFRKALYGDHPYGKLYPTEEQLQSYTHDQVRAFYGENFGARRTHVYVAGVFDGAAMKQAISRAFGDWTAGADPMVLPPTPSEGKQYVDIIDMPDAHQSNVYVGLPVIDPSSDDYVRLLVTNALLGGSFGSRITANIREDKGYTYSPRSQVSVRVKDGYWAEIAAVTTDVTGPALDEIYHEINRLQDEAPGAEELGGIQNYLAGVFTLQNSTRQGIISQLSFANLHGLDDSYLTRYVGRVHAVSAEEVSEVARKYLRDEDMTVVIVGDRSQISEQVATYVDRPE